MYYKYNKLGFTTYLPFYSITFAARFTVLNADLLNKYVPHFTEKLHSN